ncbi:MAG: ABC-2 family transporter protein [Gemmataceae bacterium]|nr:ABC-2 family transporter protein [Gemmataceae bacterium]
MNTLSATPGILAAFRKYLRIFRVSLTERFAYRGDFFLGTFLRFLPMLTTILLWTAVFDGAKESGREELGGYRYREMIAYLLLVHISRMFSSMPGLASGIARDIRDGSLKKYLVQPLDLIGYLISYRAAHKAAYIVTSALPYAVIFGICYRFFDHWPDAITLVAYLISLLLAFVVGFAFEACVGMIGFWLLEVSSVLYIIMTLNYFVSGHMFPIDVLGEPWATFLKLLPTQYLAYFPATVFLGKTTGLDLTHGLIIEAIWAVVLLLLARVLYRTGLRRYSAYGG